MAEDKDEINSPQESMEQAMKAIWWANSKDGIERVAEVADTITVREITRELLCG
jgi:hypothetical protein